MQSGDDIAQKLENLLSEIPDPEIPVITISELGILREIDVETKTVTITPTYSGCPAMDMISAQIRLVLDHNGFRDYKIISKLSPAWTTDWMTDAAKEKLKAYGIAPPKPGGEVLCPQCGSVRVDKISDFGSTSCKALYQCTVCREPFDLFKCH